MTMPSQDGFAPHAAPPVPGARLSAHELRRSCDPQTLGFTTTAELAPSSGRIDQDRAAAAIEFALGVPGPGYNMLVTGRIGHRAPDDRRDAARRARRTPPGSRRLGLPVQLRRAGPTDRRAPAERSRARARGGDGGLRRGGRPGDPARVRERQLPRAAQRGGGRPRAAPPGGPGAGPRRCGAPARRGRADPYGCRDGSARRRPPRRSRRAPAAAAGDQGRARLRAARHRGGDRGAREDVPPDRSRGARARARAGSRRRAVRRRPSDRRRQGPLRADPGGRGLAGAGARGRDRQPRPLHRHDGAGGARHAAGGSGRARWRALHAPLWRERLRRPRGRRRGAGRRRDQSQLSEPVRPDRVRERVRRGRNRPRASVRRRGPPRQRRLSDAAHAGGPLAAIGVEQAQGGAARRPRPAREPGRAVHAVPHRHADPRAHRPRRQGRAGGHPGRPPAAVRARRGRARAVPRARRVRRRRAVERRPRARVRRLRRRSRAPARPAPLRCHGRRARRGARSARRGRPAQAHHTIRTASRSSWPRRATGRGRRAARW